MKRFLSFAEDVYAGNPYWVPPDHHHVLGLLDGSAPQGEHTKVRAFWVEEDGMIVATVAAVIDDLFNRHWNDRLGHLFFFEALPERENSVQALFRAACEWLRDQGCRSARSSFMYVWQLPLTIDGYDAVPTLFHTYNPAYYHSYVKNCGFSTERGLVEYDIQLRPRLRPVYEGMIERAAKSGVRLRSWNFDCLEDETAVFLRLQNETFRDHWGAPQFTLAEARAFTVGLRDLLVPDFTVFASVGGETVGFVYALPDLNQAAHRLRERGGEDAAAESLKHMRAIDHGVLLSIGVKESHRGRGINLAMSARSLLAMMDRGYSRCSYTIVLDDNWPSRRTGEKLGGRVTRNFNVYWKELQ